MRSIVLALFAITIIIVVLMPDESSGSPARFRGKVSRFGRKGRSRSPFRRGIGSFRRSGRRRNTGLFQARRGRTLLTKPVSRRRRPFVRKPVSRRGRIFSSRVVPRRGRTFPSQDVLPPQSPEPIASPDYSEDLTDNTSQDYSQDYDGSGDDTAGEATASADVPHWCNPSHSMGSWMNFSKLRRWCSDNGYSKFGPYGGVPASGGSGNNDYDGSGSDYDESIDRLDTNADVDGNAVEQTLTDDDYEY